MSRTHTVIASPIGPLTAVRDGGALVVVQAATSGRDLVLDGRLAGLAVAAVALALRAPFIVVLVLAGATGALVHVLAG